VCAYVCVYVHVRVNLFVLRQSDGTDVCVCVCMFVCVCVYMCVCACVRVGTRMAHITGMNHLGTQATHFSRCCVLQCGVACCSVV